MKTIDEIRAGINAIREACTEANINFVAAVQVRQVGEPIFVAYEGYPADINSLSDEIKSELLLIRFQRRIEK